MFLVSRQMCRWAVGQPTTNGAVQGVGRRDPWVWCLVSLQVTRTLKRAWCAGSEWCVCGNGFSRLASLQQGGGVPHGHPVKVLEAHVAPGFGGSEVLCCMGTCGRRMMRAWCGGGKAQSGLHSALRGLRASWWDLLCPLGPSSVCDQGLSPVLLCAHVLLD